MNSKLGTSESCEVPIIFAACCLDRSLVLCWYAVPSKCNVLAVQWSVSTATHTFAEWSEHFAGSIGQQLPVECSTEQRVFGIQF